MIGEFRLDEGSVRRAIDDTHQTIDSSWWFWGAQSTGAAATSIWAVTVYPKDATTMQQTIIQAVAVLGGFVLLGLLVFLANLFALSPRRQLREAREEVKRLGVRVGELEQARISYEELLAARVRLGELLGDASELLQSPGSKDWFERVKAVSERALDLFGAGTSVFDTSHSGRLRAAVAKARYVDNGRVSDLRTEQESLMAVVATIETFVEEVNVHIAMRQQRIL